MVPSLESLASLTEADVARMRVFTLRDHLVQMFDFDEKDFTKNHNDGKSLLKRDYADRLNEYVKNATAHVQAQEDLAAGLRHRRRRRRGRTTNTRLEYMEPVVTVILYMSLALFIRSPLQLLYL